MARVGHSKHGIACLLYLHVAIQANLTHLSYRTHDVHDVYRVWQLTTRKLRAGPRYKEARPTDFEDVMSPWVPWG